VAGVVLKVPTVLQAGTGKDIDWGSLDGERFNVWVPDFACNSAGFESRFQQNNFLSLSNEETY